MNIDPAGAATMEAAVPYKCHYLLVGDEGRLMHPLVGREEPGTAAAITDQKLPEDELVSYDFVSLEERVQSSGVWLPA